MLVQTPSFVIAHPFPRNPEPWPDMDEPRPSEPPEPDEPPERDPHDPDWPLPRDPWPDPTPIFPDEPALPGSGDPTQAEP